ncbi:MAG: glutamate synthase subunit beta [Deltaproteobacteria bacterium]|nr:glutamate synthase subunit beta [Deltaproteobacteria bacterium]MBW2396358.1 glutamate synthase subunit beta [Deltaproteobacteria bacterium]
MGDARGFLKHGREGTSYRPVEDRLDDWQCVQEDFPTQKAETQASRCMDCGIPFCNSGCPLGNVIPDFNDLVFRDKWEDALARLHSTNNFPEFTGMVCPAPCEQACVLGINQDPVTIKQIEWEIVRRGWDEGWVRAQKPERRTGRSVAVVGSGPAGLSAAQQLTRAGHTVTLFEKSDRIGGLLRYGIPDFKLEKGAIDRRLEQMREEGVSFQTGVQVGVDLSVAELRKSFDAVLLCLGAEQPRDLPVPGRELVGVHFAMDFLPQQNRRVAGDTVPEAEAILAGGKHVVVLGGGDTGSDCIGTSLRHGAASVTSLELLPQPPEGRHESEPWPQAKKYYFNVSSSHVEGGERRYAMMTKDLVGEGGQVKTLRGVEVAFDRDELNRPLMPSMREVPGSEFELPADLVLLAMGFLGPVKEGLVEGLGVELDPRGNVLADTKGFATSEAGVFAAGDCRRGQSLVVWAQWEGREAARAVDAYLMGSSRLQARDQYV